MAYYKLIVSALAVFRLSRLVALDTIAEPLRIAVGRRASGGGAWRWGADLINCPFCLGVWFAALVVLSGERLQVLWSILAAAGLQDILETYAQKRG